MAFESGQHHVLPLSCYAARPVLTDINPVSLAYQRGWLPFIVPNVRASLQRERCSVMTLRLI